MNSRLVIGVIIIVLIGLGIIAGVYYFYEKPKQDMVIGAENNFSIAFFDAVTKKQIVADYIIVIDGTIFKRGTSLSEGFIREKIPSSNSTIYVYSINGSKKYYNTQYLYFGMNSNTTSNIKADIELTTVGQLEINQLTDIDSETKALELSSNGTIKSLFLCLTWSNNYITANLVNYTRAEVPDFMLTKANKCYDTQEFLKSSNLTFWFTYKKYQELTESDYIKVYIFDRDITVTSVKNCPGNCYNIREDDGADMGIEDVIFELR